MKTRKLTKEERQWNQYFGNARLGTYISKQTPQPNKDEKES